MLYLFYQISGLKPNKDIIKMQPELSRIHPLLRKNAGPRRNTSNSLSFFIQNVLTQDQTEEFPLQNLLLVLVEDLALDFSLSPVRFSH